MCRFKQKDAKIVVVQETTQEIQINESRLLNHIHEMLHTTITHEVKTPLNAILLTTQQLCHTVITNQQAKLLQINLVSAKQMLYLITDLIDMNLIRKGKFEVKLSRTNLKQAVRELITLCSMQANEKKIGIEVNIEEDTYEEDLVFDDQRIRSVIINIVNNSIKFSHVNGEIKIEAGFSDSQKKDRIILKISDTGIGMTDQVKESIFTMFQSVTKRANQLDEDQKKTFNNTSGTGLGLTFCKSMIERLGGRIGFESEKGVGTVFFVEFPVRRSTDQDYETIPMSERSTECTLIERL